MKQNENFITNLYPSSKFFIPLFVSISILIVPSYLYAYLMFPLCALLAIFAGKGREFFNLAIKGLLLVMVFIFIIQCIFAPGEEILWKWGILSIKEEGLQLSLILTSRILAIGSAFILFFRITPIKDIVYALEKVGMSPKFTYVFLSIFQIIPEISKLSKSIMDAQKTRGVETEGKLLVRAKAFIPIIGPLVLGSIASTEERAVTLESRAFSAKGKKTSLHELTKTKVDMIIQISVIVSLVFLIVGRIFLWN
jgi:energy-coupling factor transporter transmembrane protein EcfT